MRNAEIHSHEIVSFQFKPEISYDQQRTHLNAMHQWLVVQPGFVERRCYYDEQHNRWIDLVTWENASLAQAAMARSLEDQALSQVLSSIDGASITMGHYEHIPLTHVM